jgi:hypothetical protein
VSSVRQTSSMKYAPYQEDRLGVEEWENPASEKDDGLGVKSELESDDDKEDLDDVDSPLTSAPAYLPLPFYICNFNIPNFYL